MDIERDPMSTEKREETSRRGFLGWVVMLGSVAASYGLFGGFALRFIFPRAPAKRKSRMFVGFADEVQPGESSYFTTPDGEEYVLTNTMSGTTPFQAYSSRCPHLGCRVHWQGDQNRYFCPCHGGAFNQSGEATAGPPAQAGQRLKACEIEQDGKSLYAIVEVA